MNSKENHSSQINLRAAKKSDLAVINRIIERSVKTWKLPERVIRLAMPTYLYTEYDLLHLQMVLAVDRAAGVMGVAAWEEAATRDCPQGQRGMLLHGLYVDPEQQHRGAGIRLLSAAAVSAREHSLDGLLVKAQADAESFFRAQGLQQLAVVDANRDYPNRYWLDTRSERENKTHL